MEYNAGECRYLSLTSKYFIHYNIKYAIHILLKQPTNEDRMSLIFNQ